MLVIIDNYDSFTYNLVHFLGELGAQSQVLRNDQVTSEDVLGLKSGQGGKLQAAMRQIGEVGRGVVVLIREDRPATLAERLPFELGQTSDPGHDLRDYGVGAQILLDLGVRNMILLSNSRRTIVGLEGYGLTVIDYRPVSPR